MQAYKLTFDTFEPLTIIARDHDSAAALFMGAFVLTFGNAPTADFTTTELEPEPEGKDAALLALAAGTREGIAWPTSDGWALHSPFPKPKR